VRVEGEYVFDGPRDEVWEMVREPEVLATALPGTQRLDRVSENEYTGTMNVRVGPVAGAFSGRIVISDEVPPDSYTLSVEGKGGPGFVKGIGYVNLVDQGDGTTLMKYEGDMQMGGRLASVGQRLMDTVSKSMVREGLESLNEALRARMAAKSGGHEQREVEYTPPSEAEFAAAVGKDVAGQVFSPSRALWIAIAVVVVVAIIAVILLTTGGG